MSFFFLKSYAWFYLNVMKRVQRFFSVSYSVCPILFLLDLSFRHDGPFVLPQPFLNSVSRSPMAIPNPTKCGTYRNCK